MENVEGITKDNLKRAFEKMIRAHGVVDFFRYYLDDESCDTVFDAIGCNLNQGISESAYEAALDYVADNMANDDVVDFINERMRFVPIVESPRAEDYFGYIEKLVSFEVNLYEGDWVPYISSERCFLLGSDMGTVLMSEVVAILWHSLFLTESGQLLVCRQWEYSNKMENDKNYEITVSRPEVNPDEDKKYPMLFDGLEECDEWPYPELFE